MAKVIYTCGPMTGLTPKDASEWREIVERELGDAFVVLSPLRVEGALLPKDEVIGALPDSKEPTLQGAAIYHRDIFDIDRTDILLANLTNVPDGPCIGSVFEIGYAAALKPKPAIIVVAPAGSVFARHPLITTPANVVFETLAEAIYHIRHNFEVFR